MVKKFGNKDTKKTNFIKQMELRKRSIEEELLELIEQQKTHLLKLGREIIPTLTPEDILQPFDYPLLENNPLFRYEEGILAGMMSALYTFYASKSHIMG